MEFGKSLRSAREARGYTVQQLAEMTRMAPAMVENLEAEDFSHIAAPIYGRGFVKLYCEAVGLEFKPFIDEFMEIVNGNRQPQIRERPATAVREEPPQDKPVQTPSALEPTPEPAPEEPLPQPDLFSEPADAPQPSVARYATPFRTAAPRGVPAAFWRIGALALGALALLVLMFLGLRALYRATAPAVPEEEPAPRHAPQENPQKAASPAAPRTQQKIPAFYID